MRLNVTWYLSIVSTGTFGYWDYWVKSISCRNTCSYTQFTMTSSAIITLGNVVKSYIIANNVGSWYSWYSKPKEDSENTHVHTTPVILINKLSTTSRHDILHNHAFQDARPNKFHTGNKFNMTHMRAVLPFSWRISKWLIDCCSLRFMFFQETNIKFFIKVTY